MIPPAHYAFFLPSSTSHGLRPLSRFPITCIIFDSRCALHFILPTPFSHLAVAHEYVSRTLSKFVLIYVLYVCVAPRFAGYYRGSERRQRSRSPGHRRGAHVRSHTDCLGCFETDVPQADYRGERRVCVATFPLQHASSY